MLRYRGRVVTDSDIVFVREVIAAEPSASRRSLSKKVCEAWGWRQTNGALSDLVCRGLMLELERLGELQLPPRRRIPHNPLAKRRRPAYVAVDRDPVRCSLRELGPLIYRQVRRTREEALFNGLIEEHHYLGYTQPVGAHLKYLVCAGERPVSALAFQGGKGIKLGLLKTSRFSLNVSHTVVSPGMASVKLGKFAVSGKPRRLLGLLVPPPISSSLIAG